MLAFTAEKLLTPTDAVEHPVVLVEQGRVLEISARSEPTGSRRSFYSLTSARA